jgi:ubiquinone/menaquinone biosynthesis C-methylase UbiE
MISLLKKKQNKIFKELNTLVFKFPYLVVFICHEYYRNIEVIDPYLTFEKISARQRILKMQKKIIKLINIFNSFKNYNLNYSKDDYIKNAFGSRNEHIYNKQKFFNKEKFIKSIKFFLEERFKSLNFNPYLGIKGKKVLDCGCGAGRFTYCLSLYKPKKIYGIDISKDNIKIAKKNFKKSNIIYKLGDNLKIPFKNNTFDFVYSSGVAHHTTNIKKAINELFRVCKNGGLIYLYVYGKGGIYWDARQKMNFLMKKIPQLYSQKFLDAMFMPRERLMFLDNWYCDFEKHSSNSFIYKHLLLHKPSFIKKMNSGSSHDLSTAINKNKRNKQIWGDGDLRYIIKK